VAFNAATQSLTYTANAAAQNALAEGQTATDAFTYTLADAAGAHSTATATITVTGVNVRRFAMADGVAVNENASTANLVPLLLGNDRTDVGYGDTRRNQRGQIPPVRLDVSFDAATQDTDLLGNAAVQNALAAGQTAPDTFSLYGR